MWRRRVQRDIQLGGGATSHSGARSGQSKSRQTAVHTRITDRAIVWLPIHRSGQRAKEILQRIQAIECPSGACSHFRLEGSIHKARTQLS